MSIAAELQMQDGGRFFQTTLTEAEYMNLLRSGGILDGKQFTAIKLFSFPENEDQGLIYDFMLAKKGTTPWRTTPLNI